jgi:hypothetical protein
MSGNPPAEPVHYPLFTTEGPRRLVLRFRDEGVVPEADALAYSQGGATRTVSYGDVTGVRLSTNLAGRSPIGECRLEFRHGPPISVMSCAASGLGDSGRTEVYRRFVADLHERLVASGAAAHIAFQTGYAGLRRGVLLTALFAAGALFVVLPIILLIVTREPRTLIVAIAGGVLFYPAWRVARANRPTTYRPEDPPDLLG